MVKKNYKIKILIYLLIANFISLVPLVTLADCIPSSKNANFEIFNVLPFGPSNCVAAKDDLIFVGNGGTVLICDSRNISAPEKLSEIKTSGIIMKMELSDNLLYIAAGCDGMYVFDIKDPRLPKCVVHLSIDKWCSSIFLYKDLIFLGMEGSFKVFKINNSDPANISLIKERAIKAQVENMFIEEGILFVTCRTGGLYIFNLNDDFKKLRQIFLPNKIENKGVYGLVYSKGYIYFSFGNMIYALDIKSFAYKKVPLRVPAHSNIYDMLIKENFIYVLCDESIYVFQIKHPFSFTPKGKYPLPGDHARRCFMLKNLILVSDEDGGVFVFDVSIPERLNFKSRIRTPREITSVAVDKNNLFAFDYNGLSIYNIQDPLKLEYSNKISLEYIGLIKAKIQENHLFILREYSEGLYYIQILEMPEFKKIQLLKFSGEIFDFEIKNNKLFVIGDNSHFYVYDFKSIKHLKLEYSAYVPGYLGSINFYRDDLFITEYDWRHESQKMLKFKLDNNGSIIKEYPHTYARDNPLGDYVKSILHSDSFDKLLEYGPYTYITKDRCLYIFSKINSNLKFLHSALLPDTIRDLSVMQIQDVIYLYLAVEDAGLYVLKHSMSQ